MATTSLTRSMRRTEGRQPLAANTRRNHTLVNYGTKSTRTKRRLEPSDADYVFKAKKKSRLMGIAVEIPARASVALTRKAAESAAKTAHPSSQARPPGAASKRPSPRSALLATGTRRTVAQHPTTNVKPAGLPKHLGRTAAALKNELNSLQPAQDVAKDQGRKLRSQEATRFKSELSAYFPEYDEVIGNEPKEHYILNPETSILISDSRPKSADRSASGAQLSSAESNLEPGPPTTYTVRRYGDTLFTDLFDAQTIDFSFLEARFTGKLLEDTLPDTVFEPAHKKAERLERSIRNSEKGRAQHEKDQIIRLLEGLEGHDWLRVMGVSGVTESRKKTFEPARDHFIKGCQSILEKFRAWAAEEKRRKLEKDRALADAKKESEDRTDGEADAEEVLVEAPGVEEDQAHDGEDSDEESEGGPPDIDIDFSIAKQLQEEARAAVKKRSRRGHEGSQLLSPPESQTHRAFTSFFDKKYQRDAALSKNRRRGRSVLAWGHAVPEMAEVEFVLPEEFRDEDTLKVQARRKRREKRDKL